MKGFGKWLMAVGLLTCFAGVSYGQIAADDASNYETDPAVYVWNNGEGFGTGFANWQLPGAPGSEGFNGAFIGGAEKEAGVPMPNFGPLNSDGVAFSIYAGGDGAAYQDAVRPLIEALSLGNELSFSVGFSFDNGAKGFDLYSSTANRDDQVFNFNIAASGYSWTGGGSADMTEWVDVREDGVVIDFLFTRTPAGFDYEISSEQDEGLTQSGSIEAAGIGTIKFYISNAGGGDPGNLYFNYLLIEEGTAPALAFVDGEANPITAGSYSMTLQRANDGDSEAIVDLSSDNTDAVTVPASVTFDELENTVSFDADVVSVTEGSATILASNTVTGATATFTINPIAPGLAISGPFEVYALGVQTYTLTRFGDVSDTIDLTSSDVGVLTVPPTAVFDPGASETTFDANIVGYGFSSIDAADPLSPAITDYGVNVFEPSLTLTGPTMIRDGLTRTFTLTRVGPVADLVTLASTDGVVVSVPETVEFGAEDNVVTFEATAESVGTATLSATDATWNSNELAVDVYATPAGTYDEGSFYTAGWTNASNEGVGFGAWTFNHTSDPEGEPASFAGVFIGDPATASIVGMDQESFGFFANPNGSGANAEVSRSLNEALAVGQTFSFQWGLNFDSNDENSNRGFNLLAGVTPVLNVNMGNSDDIFLTVYGDVPANDVNAMMFDNYGNNAFTLHFEHVTPGNLRIYGTGRDGVEAFDNTYVVVGVPDNFAFYFNATDAGTDQRQMYVNNLRVEGEAEPEGPTIAEFSMVGMGDFQASIAGVAGKSYYLVYVTDLSTITSVNPPVLGEWSVADAEESLAVDGTVELTDADAEKGETRYYGILITDTP